MTVEGSFYVMDEYCTFLNGEFYVFVFFTTQKESLSAAETIMNSMIVGRHTFYPGGFPDLNGHWSAEFSAKAVELAETAEDLERFNPDDFVNALFMQTEE